MSRRSSWGWWFDSVLWCAVVAASCAVLLLGWLWLAARPVPPALLVIGFLVGAPAFVCAVIFSRTFWNADGSRVVTPTLAWAKYLVVGSVGVSVTLMLAALIFLGFTPDEEVPPGQPEVAAGGYVLNQHGFRTPVPRPVYDRARLYDQRGWTAGLLVFSLAAVANLGATGERICATRSRPR